VGERAGAAGCGPGAPSLRAAAHRRPLRRAAPPVPEPTGRPDPPGEGRVHLASVGAASMQAAAQQWYPGNGGDGGVGPRASYAPSVRAPDGARRRRPCASFPGGSGR
jgi:hypothetical protein